MSQQGASRHSVATSTLVLCVAGLAACSASADRHGTGDEEARAARPIYGAKAGSAHRDAVLIDSAGGSCSGSLVSPRVVLTAGHCINAATFEVRAPYAAAQKAHGYEGVTYDGTGAWAWLHDVGLVFLDADISLDTYPAVAGAVLDAGTELVSVGRIQDGKASSTDLFESPPYAIGLPSDWPNDYSVAQGVVEPGDSGGPAKRPGDPGTIFGVASRGDAKSALIARVDQVKGWIEEQIAAHPGGGSNCGSCGLEPTDQQPSCGDLSQAWGLATLCEVNGNGACGGSGQGTWDCDACCTPSCGQLSAVNGWSDAICDNPGSEAEGWCGGVGTQTWDCGLCCPG